MKKMGALTNKIIFVDIIWNLELLLPYMSHMGICCCEGYGFQAVYFGLGYSPESHSFCQE